MTDLGSEIAIVSLFHNTRVHEEICEWKQSGISEENADT